MKFTVSLRRTVVEDVAVEVDADNLEDAKEKAFYLAANEKLPWQLEEHEDDFMGASAACEACGKECDVEMGCPVCFKSDGSENPA